MIQGEGYHEEGKRAFRPPGYPYFLAVLYTLFGAHLLPVCLVQSILAVFTCLFIFLLGKGLASERTGLWAAGFFTVYPQFIRYPGNLFVETLFIFLFIFALLFLFDTGQKPSYAKSIMAGILLGLSALVREVALFMILPILLWAILMMKDSLEKKQWRKNLSVFLMFFALTLSPWTLRNYFLFHRFIPISTNGGFNFRMGNNPQATGGYNSDIDANIKWPHPLSNESPEELLSLEIEATKTGYNNGINFIFQNPGHFFQLALKKFVLLWRPPVYKLNLRGNFNETIFRIFWLINYLVLLIFAIPGMWISIKKFGREWSLFHLLLFSVTGLHMLVFSATRYRLPMIPLLMIFAALTLDTAWTHR
ncbi:MAG: glycosyltransferase family 39 protein [Candidatus Aminicenantes bacterium]|nr:glycosyltransferase family 39 protein [Candidatus Aminicenantes bacterium]